MKKCRSQLALAGAGLVGRRHAAAIAACDHVSLAAVVDPNEEAGQSCAAAVGARWYRSLAEMFAHRRPDGVILATPNNIHVENGLACIHAGCPIMVEKPLATSAAEGQVLVDAAATANIPILVGHHRRHNPLVQKAREIIAAGKLGQLRTVNAMCWLYKPNDYFEQTSWRQQKGAGPVAVNLVHDIDLICYFCGDVESVHAHMTPAVRGYDNEDVAVAILRFASGVLGTVTVADTVVSPWSWELTAGENPVYPDTGQSCYFLGGSHGALSLPDLTLWQNNGIRSWWQPLTVSTVTYEIEEPLIKQIKHFAAVLAGTAAPLVSGADALKTLHVIEAIHQSAASGEMVSRPRLATQ